MINTEIAPIEEGLKAMLVDIVRRCQSTVAQNYERIRLADLVEDEESGHKSCTSASSSHTKIPKTQNLWGYAQLEKNPDQRTTIEDESTSWFFQELPMLEPSNANDVPPGMRDTVPEEQTSDSGYWSFGNFCTCLSQDEAFFG